MVRQSDINASNANLDTRVDDVVTVAVGATNGIGKGFVRQLALQAERPKIYIVGRTQQSLDTLITELSSLNPAGTYIGILTGDLTLLSSVRKATNQIIQLESKIDILYQSQGFLTFAGRDETVEGLDKITSIRYYARLRFITDLLPLLNVAPAPRVVSVLAGGLEGQIFADDLSLKDPKNYSVGNAAGLSATYMTLSFEQLQRSNPRVSFIHLFPGLVRTNLFKTEHFGAVFKTFVNWVVMPTVGRFLALTADDAGARALYAATHPQFGPSEPTNDNLAIGSNGTRGSGVYTLNEKTDAVHNDKVLHPIRTQGLDTKIWQHTLEEHQRILG